MSPDADILFLTNGHGEDEIARLVLDRLAPCEETRARIAAWPMVGGGERYTRAGIATFGPRNRLPSEGFGTVSLPAFLRDLRAGFLGTYLAQARHARSLRGRARAVVAIGDVVPLAAAVLSGIPTIFLSSAKSARYGGTDGHNPLERALMRRVARVFARDERTARLLRLKGVAAEFAGNPMMDGVAGADGSPLAAPDRTNVALLPGTRADASANARLLLAALGHTRGMHGLVTAAPGFDLDALADGPPEGWRVTGRDDTSLALSHAQGATAEVVPGRFAEALAASDLAVGMAGTGNEQAAGLGLPLVAVAGAGNQGAAYLAMKKRYFGAAATTAGSSPGAIATALTALAEDPARRREMAEAGRALMGAPGASAAIADAARTLAGWEPAHG